MTVWITGGAGFLGSHLCDRFLAGGWEVWGLDNFASGSHANLASASRQPGFHLVAGDCTLRETLAGLPRPDLVCHLASLASPVRYQADPLGTMRANAIGTWHLLEACRDAGARFLLASTSEVYGDPAVVPQPESYRGNVNCYGPRACYDESKRFAETLCWEFARRGVDVRVARIFNTFGPRMDAADGRVVPNFIRCALAGLPLPVHGDGRQTRSLLYVDDLIEGLWRLATAEGARGLLVNLGGEVELTVLEIAERIRRLTGAGVPVRHEPAAPDDPRRRRADVALARRVLGWSPSVSVDEGLRRTIAWFRSQQGAPAAAGGSQGPGRAE
jgi:nucleoside-diphosphate-sugar epimerase